MKKCKGKPVSIILHVFENDQNGMFDKKYFYCNQSDCNKNLGTPHKKSWYTSHFIGDTVNLNPGTKQEANRTTKKIYGRLKFSKMAAVRHHGY